MNAKICAACEHFSAKNHPEKAKLGIGQCNGYDNPVEPFVRWDARVCVLFGRAKNMSAREPWITARKQIDAESIQQSKEAQ